MAQAPGLLDGPADGGIGFDVPIAWWAHSLIDWPAAPELAWLSAEEQARAARFRFDRDRRRYLAAHVALRRRLSVYTGLSPQALRWQADERGKPQLVEMPHRQFNLSHSGEEALIAVCDAGPIGVDIEELREVQDTLAMARAYFTPQECEAVAGAAGPARDAVFLTIWTRKEACLKAVGFGLHLDPLSVEVGVGDALTQVRLPVPGGQARLSLLSFRPTATSVGAVCRVLD